MLANTPLQKDTVLLPAAAFHAMTKSLRSLGFTLLNTTAKGWVWQNPGGGLVLQTLEGVMPIEAN
jgi:hypothetical protein